MPRELNQNSNLLFARRCFWRETYVDRLSILIDAKAYFESLAASLESAEKSICIMGWDLDTRIRLRRIDPKHSKESLGALISRLVRKRSELHVYVLIWNFFFIMSRKRMLPPWFRRDWTCHPRIHFVYDVNRPIESSRHEKFVLIDRKLAYLGCTDLSRERWDVPGHTEFKEFRVNPDGHAYRPHHDLQAVFNGEAAELLAQHFENEWRRSTGEIIRVEYSNLSSTWLKQLKPDFENAHLYFSRTSPPQPAYPPVREIEDMLLELIKRAERFIYIEMQYMSAENLISALIEKLREEKGPYILIILPHAANSFIERRLMSVLQARQLLRLKASDPYSRLKICYPVLPPPEFDSLMLHSKLMIVDGTFLHLGSANFTRRSMGLDSELNFTLVAESQKDRDSIQKILGKLLAEFMGLELNDVLPQTDDPRSLFAYIDNLKDRDKALKDMEIQTLGLNYKKFIDGEYSDPSQPYAIEEIRLLNIEKVNLKKKLWLLVILFLAFGFLIAAVWYFTDLDEKLRSYILTEAHTPSVSNITAILFILSLASVLMMPITLITLGCVFLFGPWGGAASSMLVALLSASISYFLGRFLDSNWLGGVFGKALDKVAKKLQSANGLTMMVLIRLLPVAPFGVVNLAGGLSRVSFILFILGVFIGLLPSKIVLAVFADRAFGLIRNPSFESFALLIFVSLVVLGVIYVSSRWLERRFLD